MAEQPCAYNISDKNHTGIRDNEKGVQPENQRIPTHPPVAPWTNPVWFSPDKDPDWTRQGWQERYRWLHWNFLQQQQKSFLSWLCQSQRIWKIVAFLKKLLDKSVHFYLTMSDYSGWWIHREKLGYSYWCINTLFTGKTCFTNSIHYPRRSNPFEER